jgi:hypothetical protein
VFDGDPQDRAKDRDRDRAIYVIDAALRNGQISQQDRDLRVERVRSAATVGELGSLVRDISTPPAAVPATAVVPPPVVPATAAPPVAADPYATGSQRPTAPVPSDLYGPARSKRARGLTSSTKATGPSGTGRKVALGCMGVSLLFFIGPIIAGVALFAGSVGDDSSGASTEAPVPAGPPFELTKEGIRDFIATFEDSFGDTQVVRSVFYDGYVVSWVPTGHNDNLAIWNYQNGAFEQLGDPMDGSVDSAPVDLADLRPGRVMALVDTAQATLNVDAPSTTYIIFDRDIIDDDPQLAVYVTNELGDSGYLLGDLRGNVISTQAND